MAFVKPIREYGMVICKEIIEARQAGESFDGSRKWDARPEQYEVEVISCDQDDFDKEKGIPNGTRCKYKVDKATFDKIKFGDWVNVKFTASQYSEKEKLQIKPETLTLIDKK